MRAAGQEHIDPVATAGRGSSDRRESIYVDRPIERSQSSQEPATIRPMHPSRYYESIQPVVHSDDVLFRGSEGSDKKTSKAGSKTTSKFRSILRIKRGGEKSK